MGKLTKDKWRANANEKKGCQNCSKQLTIDKWRANGKKEEKKLHCPLPTITKKGMYDLALDDDGVVWMSKLWNWNRKGCIHTFKQKYIRERLMLCWNYCCDTGLLSFKIEPFPVLLLLVGFFFLFLFEGGSKCCIETMRWKCYFSSVNRWWWCWFPVWCCCCGGGCGYCSFFDLVSGSILLPSLYK